MILKEKKKVKRLLDANVNRLKEGLRVCEDVARFVLDDKKSTRQYKAIRHQISKIYFWNPAHNGSLIGARDILRDVGMKSTSTEFKRKNIKDIFFANSGRTKESIRVLEEFSKLDDKRTAESLKRIRYKIYSLEHELARKL